VDDQKTSLYFEVWERALPDAVEVAVVFRGTHEWKDWWSNLRWVTRFIPIGWDQYDLTRSEIVKVVSRAKQRHRTVQMVTAGHSLGGGLAQQAAYAHPEITHVYAFDSSPVTGFRSVPQPARDANRQGIVIDRVYERGEILAYVRTFLRRLIPLSLKDPSITEIRFNVTGQSISKLLPSVHPGPSTVVHPPWSINPGQSILVHPPLTFGIGRYMLFAIN
jgi:pimeloyl-ACP methyl ester carboxylesterase